MNPKNPTILFVSILAFALSCVSPASAAETASLSGTVRNIATGNALESARVEVPALNAKSEISRTSLWFTAESPSHRAARNNPVSYQS